ncbi:MAG: hypothetical protein ACXVHB_25325 [Solirubrobacteraceae bacterium]
MRLAARSTVAAICLAIVALAPTAAARPAFDPPSVSVNPSTGYTLQDKSVTQTTVVRSNPDQQVARHGVPIPPILGKTQAAEQAAIDRLKAQHYTDKLPVNAAYSAAALNGYGSPHPVRVQAPKTPSANPDNGFDWGDAAIGAAAGLTLTLLVGGGAMVLSRRRSPRGDSANVATT